MMPILFSIGPFSITSFAVCVVFGWMVCSFLFWRHLRSRGVDEQGTFDTMFYSTLLALLFSRVGYVAFHPGTFMDVPLRIITPWVAPGLSGYAALIGVLASFVVFSRQRKIRFSHLLDGFALSFGPALLFFSLAGFLDGSVVGTASNLPFAVRFISYPELRHPIGLYFAVFSIVLSIVSFVAFRKFEKRQSPFGHTGLLFFLFFSVGMILLETFRDHEVYWRNLSAPQILLIALCTQTLGALYIRSSIRIKIRHRLQAFRKLVPGVPKDI